MNHDAIRGRADEQLFAEERNERENEHFIEMAVLRKNRTKLPVNIFLDDEGRWMQSGHLNLIKFQPDTGERADSSRMVSLSIEDEPRILDGKDFIKITPSQLEEVKQFVRNNKDLIVRLGRQEIDIGDFISEMKLNN